MDSGSLELLGYNNESLTNESQRNKKMCPTDMLLSRDQQEMQQQMHMEDTYNLQAAVMRGIKAGGHGNYLGGTRSQT